MLGKSNADYTTWIQKPTAWGGAIELAIFSQIYQTELVAFDIIHMNKYTFGKLKLCFNCLYSACYCWLCSDKQRSV